MALQRPLKEGNVRTYQEKVGLGYLDILASEMDADLDTIYAAWNGGVATANIQDGAVTAAKLAPDAKPWVIAGNTVVPADATKTVAAPGSVSGDSLHWGSRTAKGRLCHNPAADAFSIRANVNQNNVPDNTAIPAWSLAVSPAGDLVSVNRFPAGSSASTALLLLEGSSGNLTVGSRAFLTPRLTVAADPAQAYIAANQVGSPSYDSGKPTWLLAFNYTSDAVLVQRQGVTLVTVDNASHVTGGNYRATGATSGLRCQNVGSTGGDGYSNAIGLGWDGTLKARVDGTQIGTITVTGSDARIKRDIIDDVPGLDAVLALRPVSFAYDQTKRAVGFPTGRRYGLLAQDVEPYAPLVVADDGSEDHWLGIEYGMLVPVLIRALQELAARVAALEARA